MTIKEEKIAIISDLHIGKHQNSTLWHQISLDFTKWFKTKLLEANIKDIIMCGDINNDRSEISIQSLHVVNELFTILKDFNIILIVGNHDAYYKNRSDVNSLSLFSGWKNINIVDKMQEYTTFGKKIVFCPWGTNVEDIPNCDYLFGHFDINGFSLSKVKICTAGVDSTKFLKCSPLTISGHYHLRQDRKYKNGKILYVGSPYELDWSDCGTDSRGFYIMDIPSGNYDFVENNISPKHKKIRLSEITSGGKVSDDIKAEFPGNFVNFIVDQDITDSEKLGKLSDFVNVLQNTLHPIIVKTDYLLETRVTVDDTKYEFTAVDIPTSIEEFIKMTDLENKDDVLAETLSLYNMYKG